MNSLLNLFPTGALAPVFCRKAESEPAVESIELDKPQLDLRSGESARLRARVCPVRAGRSLTWRSSDPQIAAVGRDGVVRALKSGRVTITAAGGGRSASCTVEIERSVYVAGQADRELPKGALWRNGEVTELPFSYANSLFVDRGDVYVAGIDIEEDRTMTVLWKNGSVERLGSGNFGKSVFVRNGKVYVAGGNNPACVWEDGTLRTLGGRVGANSVFVTDGGDVYVAGYKAGSERDKEAVYWKNGVEHPLPGGYEALSICVAGGRVYAVGNSLVGDGGAADRFRAMLWIDGRPAELEAGRQATGVGIADNGEVCATGTALCGAPGYWRNGRFHPLVDKAHLVAPSLCVCGEDIYLAGSETANPRARYWKNNRMINLSDQYSLAKAIFVF